MEWPQWVLQACIDYQISSDKDGNTVLLHEGHRPVVVKDGEWIIKCEGRGLVKLDDETFKSIYTKV